MNYVSRGDFSKNSNCLIDILKNRGVKDIEGFLRPSRDQELDFMKLDNIEDGVSMLLNHLRENKKIYIQIDSDVDGLTSAAIIWLYIKNIFPNANLTFGVHEGKKHGIEDKIDYLIDVEQYDLIIIPDAGSNDIEFFERLNDIGTDVLCIDHHLCEYEGYDCLPDNVVLINNQQSARYENKFLCGAGVVYKFCEALDAALGINKAHDFIDLAALGEIADVMSKTDTEANYIMMEGLKNIRNKGFQTLLKEQSFSLKEKAMPPYNGLTTIDVAFYIAPLLNAIVRVGSAQENMIAFLCFVDPDRQVPSTKRGAKAGDMETAAAQTARVGKNSKAKQDRIKHKAMDLIDFKIQMNNLDENKILIIELDEEDNIPTTMTGLIAQNVSAKYNKPVLIVREANDHCLKGSIRGNENFSAVPQLKSYLIGSGYFEFVQGHENAAGCSLPEKNLDKFLNFSNKDLPDNAFDKCYKVDYIFDANESSLEEVGMTLAANNAYFGNGIDEVKVAVTNISLGNIFVMGSDKSSIKITQNHVDYVRFKDLTFVEKIMENRLEKLNVIARFNLNEFNGKTSLQCFIDDYEIAHKDDSRFDF